MERPSASRTMKLVIFYLDQTLVDLITLHNETTHQVFRAVFGVDAGLTEVDFAGRSLKENFAALAKLKNISEEKFREKSQELLKRYEERFVEHFPEEPSRYILPGAKELLKNLSKTEHVVSLYTGNSPRIVDKVLATTRLARYFRFCAYGTEVNSRSDMVRIAIKRAEELTKRRFRGKDIVIVGDSVRDIECGREFQALTIAVATGFHSEKELLEQKPDYIFKDLRDTAQVLQAISFRD